MEFEYRKIIKFGNSSHVVSLPTSWLRKNNLNKGDKIYFHETSNNEIMLFTSLRNAEEDLKQININGTRKSLDFILNSIILAYMNDFRIIKIMDKNLDKRCNEIRSIINALPGLEVIEQKSDVIVVKDYLNINDISIETLIRRIDILLKNMINNSKECLSNDYRVSINNSDFDINRLFFVFSKTCTRALENPQLAKELNLNTYDLVQYYRMASILESFGDECKRVARLFREGAAQKKNLKDILENYEVIEKLYNQVMLSIFTKNPESSLNIIEGSKLETAKITKYLLGKYDVAGLIEVRLVEKLKNMLGLIKRLARLSLNLAVKTDSKNMILEI